MHISVRHATTYRYDSPIPYGLTQVRLTPKTSTTQAVNQWRVQIDGGTKQVAFEDQHRNVVELFATDRDATELAIEVTGEVETKGSSGLVEHVGLAPLWLYLRETDLTREGAGVRELRADLGGEPQIGELHDLSARVLTAVRYETGRTDAGSTAEEAVAAGAGVCQDHAHIFIASCRNAGIPSRYVSGYLFVEDETHGEASHAWAEAWVDGLGWVGFDVSNGISPDERYVRIATGMDYDDVAPISGMRHGSASESMDVSIEVREQTAQ